MDLQSYRILLDNACDVPLKDVAIACTLLQEHCLHEETNEKIKLLEQMAVLLYKKLYPKTFGGIFEALSKTIGFTHCHYLDGSKFKTFEENKYRVRCNILTNCIEDLPDSLQPICLEELIHMLHLISYTQNAYYDKHMASLAFDNKEQLVGGRFWIYANKLVIVWNDDDAFQAYTNNIYELAHNACDVIVDTRKQYPILASNKKLFAEWLNTWWNKAIQEILFSEISLPELRNYLHTTSPTFTIWKYTEVVKNEFDNIHIVRWLLHVKKETWKSRDDVIELYQIYIDEYLLLDDSFQQVYCITNSSQTYVDHAFDPLHKKLRRLFKERYDRYFDFSPDIVAELPTPDMIIQEIGRKIRQSPHERILIVIWLHWETNGSATYAWWSFSKDHFQQLFDMCANNVNIQLFVMSCRSSRKTNTLLGNVIMSSSEQVSYVSYTKSFIEAFERGDGFYQAHMYAMMHYHQSLLPTSYCNHFGEIIELCPLGNTAKPNTFSSYIQTYEQ